MSPRATPQQSLDDTRAEPPGVDASRLSFSAKLVISLVSALATIVLPILGSIQSIRSDVRDMATRQELREDLNRQNWDILTAQMKTQAAKTELLQVDVNDLKLALARGNNRKE